MNWNHYNTNNFWKLINVESKLSKIYTFSFFKIWVLKSNLFNVFGFIVWIVLGDFEYNTWLNLIISVCLISGAYCKNYAQAYRRFGIKFCSFVRRAAARFTTITIRSVLKIKIHIRRPRQMHPRGQERLPMIFVCTYTSWERDGRITRKKKHKITRTKCVRVIRASPIADGSRWMFTLTDTCYGVGAMLSQVVAYLPIRFK